jgi:hypothetical protein
MTFRLSPCPSSGAAGNGNLTISQTANSLTRIDRISNDRPDPGVFVVVADATQQNVFGAFGLNSKGSALFEVHQTTTLPTGVNPGDTIVLAAVEGDNFVVLMASDPANCGR